MRSPTVRVSALEDYQFDRRQVYVQQCIQPSRTNARGLNSRDIAVLDTIQEGWFQGSSAQLLGTARQGTKCPSGQALTALTQVKSSFVGDSSEGGTPGPIPNPAVKPFSADGSWGASLCESRSLPTELFFV